MPDQPHPCPVTRLGAPVALAADLAPSIHGLPGLDRAGVRACLIGAAPGRAPKLRVAPAAHGRHPMERGQGPAFRCGPLTAGAGFQEAGQDTTPPRRRIVRREELRADCIPLEQILEGAAPEERWVSGFGNLGFNAGTRAWRGSDAAPLGAPGSSEVSLSIRSDGHATETSELARPSDLDGIAVCGPGLVSAGRALKPDPRAWPDPRHLLRFPFLITPSGEAVDFGLDHLLGDPLLLQAALAGDALTLPLSAPDHEADPSRAAPHFAPDPQALAYAFAIKGYRNSAALDARGTFHVEPSGVRVRFLPGLYPHQVLLTDRKGQLATLLIGGLGNRVGPVLSELAEDLARAGAQSALILDNGGDVGLYDRFDERFVLRPTEADRAESWPLAAAWSWPQV